MRIALKSDIHGNAAALDAVLEDINRRKADKIFFLGIFPTGDRNQNGHWIQ